MKITIIGGGNIGTLMAAEFACRGHEVTVYTSKPHKWNRKVNVLNTENQIVMTGTITNITDNIKEAVCGANLVWVTVPAQMFNEIADKMMPYISANQMLGVVPGGGGVEFAFGKMVKKGVLVFGLQRVHSIARLHEYGKSVYMLGRKDNLVVGTIPSNCTQDVKQLVENMFDIPCSVVPNYLCITLTPTNPILHTSRLYSMFKDYKQGMTYPKNYLFYEEWTDEASELLIACDCELQRLCDTIPLDLKMVVSLQDYYESHSVQQMTKKIRSIKAFKGITSPMMESSDGWIPDFSSRYFATDFSYGLKMIKDIIEMFHVDAPNIDRIWQGYQKFSAVSTENIFKLKIEKEDFLNLYLMHKGDKS